MFNTGYKEYTTLEEYDVNTGEPTGNTKPNEEGDPDYVAPVYDTNKCPLPVSKQLTFSETAKNACVGARNDVKNTFYMNHVSLYVSNVLTIKINNEYFYAKPGYYSEGAGVRYWNGTNFTSYQSCSLY